jgi:putative ATP-binding cassette transporter
LHIIDKKFTDFIYESSGGQKKKIYAAAAANGLCMALLMYSLTVGLDDFSQNNEVSLRGLIIFAVSLAAYYITQKLGGEIVSTSMQRGLTSIEARITDKLRRMDYAAFTDTDPEHIYAAVGGDKYGAVMAARFLLSALSSIVVVLLTGIYLCTVSIPGALLVAATLVIVLKFRKAIDEKVNERAKEDNEATDKYTSSIKDILEGFNELKMNRRRSDELFDSEIAPASMKKSERQLKSELIRMQSSILEQVTLFIPLGLTLFVLPMFAETPANDLVKIISITLIVIWPAYMLVQIGPVSSAAADTIKRLQAIEEKLDEANLEPSTIDGIYPIPPDFNEKIVCKNLVYEYKLREGDKKPFRLEIPEISLNEGELVIMRGGNGSGKSTFMRLLAGLTTPSEGNITVDGVDKTEIGEACYRSLFSLVMTDFHLFDKLYGMPDLDPDYFRKWVGILGLEEKFTDMKKLPTINLSSGQRKRAALLAAICEERKVMLLDEVAADFDPFFREKYYREILPKLKEEGKTLFVISHDDRYYDIADRIITMSEGTSI